jgi:predicted glycoside hydrolase/deacetylase ChbG (UPF0249 family)
MNRLWVNADDFGLHEDVNRAIVEGVDAGRIQSFSVSANGGAVDWPLLKALQERGACIGVHLTWVGEPWLGGGRRWTNWADLLMALMRRPGLKADVEAEGRRQIQEFSRRGIVPTHVDSHQHVHVFPGLWEITLKLSREAGIPRLRVPWCPTGRGVRRTPGGLALQLLSRWRRRAVPGAWPCLGLAHSGRNTLARVRHELQAARGTDVELVVHPGYATPALRERYDDWQYDWDAERRLIMDEAWPAVLANAGYRAG